MDQLEKIKFKLTGLYNRLIDKAQTVPLKIFAKQGKYYLVFKNKQSGKVYEIASSSKDGFSFQVIDQPLTLPKELKKFPNAQIVADYRFNKHSVMYFGKRNINIAFSDDGKTWQPDPQPVLIQPVPLMLAGAFVRPESIIILYHEQTTVDHQINYSTHLAIFDKKNPQQLTLKTNQPVWKQTDYWAEQKITPIGSLMINEQLISYWYVDNLGIFAVVIAGFKYDPNQLSPHYLKLKRPINNPIIAPKPENDWEAFNTLNPAAVYLDKKVHLLYRAQGFDYVSTVGYAISSDGLRIDRRLDRPIFAPSTDFETNYHSGVNPIFMSAGGWGGCEDPRITVIDNRLYMVYVAFDGWSPPRLAITSMSISDFLNERFLWSKPVLISPPNVVDKSGCLLPEKVNDQYVFFHRIFPNILIDFVNDLQFDGKTRWLKGEYQITVRPDYWDSHKIGAGAPPIKTKDGWLLIYYGVDSHDLSRYQVGAMLLDIDNPTKVLYRSDSPILQPCATYENAGFKPGIVYPCGAVVIKQQLLVYYGAADSVVCVASAPLEHFLNQLKNQQPIRFNHIKIKEISY